MNININSSDINIEREFIEMSFDDWFQQFTPIINTTGAASGLSAAVSDLQQEHCVFETYGCEVGRAVNVADDAEAMLHVWTLHEAEGFMYISSGFHFVNRMGYFITLEPADAGKYYEINY